MTEKTIPLSIIDAEIENLNLLGQEGSINTGRSCSFAVHVLQEIKKEAIPSPEPDLEPPQWQKVTDDIAKRLEKCLAEKTGLEQKINDRIAFLESPRLITASLFDDMLDARIIDELRKLLK